MAIDHSIDLWTFKELFVKLKYDYNFYSEHWKKISKIHLTEEQFRKALDSMKKYLNDNN